MSAPTALPGIHLEGSPSPSALVTLVTLRTHLECVWDASTSAGGFAPERPSTGHCAVTAMIVQDLLGVEILRAEIPGGSHYFNRLPCSTLVDLTRDQFDVYLPGPAELRTRGYLESSPAAFERYLRLVAALDSLEAPHHTPAHTTCLDAE